MAVTVSSVPAVVRPPDAQPAVSNADGGDLEELVVLCELLLPAAARLRHCASAGYLTAAARFFGLLAATFGQWAEAVNRREESAVPDLGWATLNAAHDSRPSRPPNGLTPREVEVLSLLARRYSNSEIAAELVLSVRTVERHIANIFSKTGSHNRREARVFAERHGFAAG